MKLEYAGVKLYIKLLILIPALICFCLSGLHAQEVPLVTVGGEGEVNSTSIKVSDIGQLLLNTVDGKDIEGYELGVYLKYNPAPVYLKTMLMFGYQSGIVEADYTVPYSAPVTISVFKLELPVLAGIKIINHLSIEAGPVYDRILSATKDFHGFNVEVAPNGFGYRIGLDTQIGKSEIFGFNVAYQSVENDSFSAYSSYSTPNEIIIGASISFQNNGTRRMIRKYGDFY
jgi:hypothetical protein